jgi:catechol 2,3-dioxygenase-like lactoylglutathione lyase family enzyme
MKTVLLCLSLMCLVPAHSLLDARQDTPAEPPLELGNFSVSLAVKDLKASRAFYEKLGLNVVAGSEAQNYLILQNATSTIGIFEGMFERNILTFNPGWNREAAELPDFQDVRDLQKRLRAEGLTFAVEADEASTGPASFVVTDPDGNPILIDQHVNRPAAKPAGSDQEKK